MASGPAGPDKSDASQNGVSRDSPASLSCRDGGRLYGTQRGLSQHVRHVHPNTYYDRDGPICLKKARWDNEEILVMARQEIRLRRSGVSNINQQLVNCMSGRTLQAIKGKRKSQAYKDLLSGLSNADQELSLIHI